MHRKKTRSSVSTQTKLADHMAFQKATQHFQTPKKTSSTKKDHLQRVSTTVLCRELMVQKARKNY